MTTTTKTLTMAELPPGYHWEIRFIWRLNTVHLSICKRSLMGLGEVQSTCSVLEFSEKTPEQAARTLMYTSHEEATRFNRHHDSTVDPGAWDDMANAMMGFVRTGNTPVKIKIDKSPSR